MFVFPHPILTHVAPPSICQGVFLHSILHVLGYSSNFTPRIPSFLFVAPTIPVAVALALVVPVVLVLAFLVVLLALAFVVVVVSVFSI